MICKNGGEICRRKIVRATDMTHEIAYNFTQLFYATSQEFIGRNSKDCNTTYNSKSYLEAAHRPNSYPYLLALGVTVVDFPATGVIEIFRTTAPSGTWELAAKSVAEFLK